VLVGLRYKLVLTAAQEQSCVRWEGICRAVWNTGLDQYRHAWRSNKARPKDAQVWPGFAVQCAELAAAKKQPGLDWLTDAPTHVLQQTLRDLDQAIRRHNPWRTHFRSQRRSAPSLRFPAGKAIVVEQLSGRWGRLKLPKLGAVKFRMPRPALSLLLSGVVIYAVLVLLGRYIGFTLDLSGIAGFIVAIGITADSFVVFFERLKDEVREGRSFRSAVPRGWVRARRTILTADAVSFLAAAVLYTLAVGQVGSRNVPSERARACTTPRSIPTAGPWWLPGSATACPSSTRIEMCQPSWSWVIVADRISPATVTRVPPCNSIPSLGVGERLPVKNTSGYRAATITMKVAK